MAASSRYRRAMRALGIVWAVVIACALTPAPASAARHCGSVHNHPRGIDRTYGLHILAFRVSCKSARAVVHAWLGHRSSYATTTSRLHGWRFIFRDPEDYLATKGGRWIIFDLSYSKNG